MQQNSRSSRGPERVSCRKLPGPGHPSAATGKVRPSPSRREKRRNPMLHASARPPCGGVQDLHPRARRDFEALQDLHHRARRDFATLQVLHPRARRNFAALQDLHPSARRLRAPLQVLHPRARRGLVIRKYPQSSDFQTNPSFPTDHAPFDQLASPRPPTTRRPAHRHHHRPQRMGRRDRRHPAAITPYWQPTG